MNYGEALRLIRSLAEAGQPLGTEEVGLEMALGRTLSERIVSEQTLPPFDNSAVDGFAVISSATQQASKECPCRFPVVGSVVAGDIRPESTITSGVWEMMTGAPFPPGFDASVKVEEVQVLRDAGGRAQEIVLTQPLSAKENWRGAGEDFSVHDSVAEKGQRVGPELILALAALGKATVRVFKFPKVAVLGTGRELAAFDAPAEAGFIRDATGPCLKALLPLLGTLPVFYGRVGDDPADFIGVMQRILEDKPQVIVTTGAVSMGVHDFVATAVRDLGGELLFHRVAIRPGKPILCARFPQGSVLFGLPGNPISTVVGARFFLSPYLRALNAQGEEKPLRMRLKSSVKKTEGLRCFFKAVAEVGEGGSEVTVLSGQPSFMIRPLLSSNAWAVLPEPGAEVAAGEWVEVYPLLPFLDWGV